MGLNSLNVIRDPFSPSPFHTATNFSALTAKGIEIRKSAVKRTKGRWSLHARTVPPNG
jgi:hypothetical protein